MEFDTAQIISGIGRSDASAYYQGDYSELSDIKAAERAKVLDFIIRTIGVERVKLLSFPGKQWRFEHMLCAIRPGTQVVGLENSLTTFLHSRRAMSTRGFPVQDREMRYGGSKYTYARATVNAQWDNKAKRLCMAPKGYRSHRLLKMDAETFMTILVTDYGQTTAERNDFYGRFGSRTAVWLDYTGPLTPSVERTLAHLPLMIESHTSYAKPVVLTLLAARDRFRGIAERIRALTEVCPSYCIRDWGTYIGKGNQPMLTVYGEIR